MTVFTEDREYFLEQLMTELTVNLRHHWSISWNSNDENDSFTTNQYGSVINLYRSDKEFGLPKLQINFQYNIFGLKLTLTWHPEDEAEIKPMYEKTILYMSLFDRFEDSNDNESFEEIAMKLSRIYAQAIKDIHLILLDKTNYIEENKEQALQSTLENMSVLITQFLRTTVNLSSMASRK